MRPTPKAGHALVVAILLVLFTPTISKASPAIWILEQIAGWGVGKIIDEIVDGSAANDVQQSRAYITQVIERPPPDVDLDPVREYAAALEKLDGLVTSVRIARSTRKRIEMAEAIQRLALDVVDLERRVSRLELRVSNLEGQVAQNTADIQQIRTDYDTLLEEQLRRRPLCEGSGAFQTTVLFPWGAGRPSELGTGAQFKFIFQGKYIFGGIGYSFAHLQENDTLREAGWTHFIFGQIGAQYHWRYLSITGALRSGYRWSNPDSLISPAAVGVALGLKLYPHHNVPFELELNAMQSDRDTSVGVSLGIGTRGEWVAAGVGIAALVLVGLAAKN